VADLNGDGCIDDADLDLITILVLPPLDVGGDGDVDSDDVRFIEEPLR
jgi:hypothetical protein